MDGEPDPRPLREEGMAIGTYATSTVFDRELAVAGAGQLVVLGGVAAAVGLSALGWVAGLAFALVTALLLARRNNTVSVLGARFDMEVDAFLILALSVLVCRTLAPWVLAIGLMRYAFVAAMFVVPRLRAPLPFSRARKVVAAMQGALLVAAAAPIWPPLV